MDEQINRWMDRRRDARTIRRTDERTRTAQFHILTEHAPKRPCPTFPIPTPPSSPRLRGAQQDRGWPRAPSECEYSERSRPFPRLTGSRMVQDAGCTGQDRQRLHARAGNHVQHMTLRLTCKMLRVSCCRTALVLVLSSIKTQKRLQNAQFKHVTGHASWIEPWSTRLTIQFILRSHFNRSVQNVRNAYRAPCDTMLVMLSLSLHTIERTTPGPHL